MPLSDAMLAIVVLIYLVVLVLIAVVGYFINWRGVPEEEVVIPPAPPEDN
jgi:phage shock protein PspC (stress-responsive transcriptional regulator)